MALDFVIALLVVIVVLLCVPVKRRPELLRYLMIVGSVSAVIFYCGPYLVGFVISGYGSAVDHFGKHGTMAMGAGIALALMIVWLWRIDNKTTTV